MMQAKTGRLISALLDVVISQRRAVDSLATVPVEVRAFRVRAANASSAVRAAHGQLALKLSDSLIALTEDSLSVFKLHDKPRTLLAEHE
jgi:hypothetical protein